MFLPLEGDGDAVVRDLISDHASYGSYAELPCVSPAVERSADYQFFYAGIVERPSPCINSVRLHTPLSLLVVLLFTLPRSNALRCAAA